ncbi:MAG: hypothetical protein HYU02_05510 [Thaumarchaeota archaeon]|nr:hypothetical protein [Nitrososphaerota archaeon]
MVNGTAIQCQYDGVAERLVTAARCLRVAGNPVEMDDPLETSAYYPNAMMHANFAADQSSGECPAALALLAIAQNGFQLDFTVPRPRHITVQRTLAEAVSAVFGSNDLNEGYETREGQRRERGDFLQGLVGELLGESPSAGGPNTTKLVENPGYLCGGCKYRVQG